jgi:hypothetical protein
MSWDDEEPDEDKRLVCGVCEEMLTGTYEDQEAAEDAADEHEAAEHPDRDQVVVVPVSSKLVAQEGVDDMVETAKGAQQRLDSGDVGEGLGL